MVRHELIPTLPVTLQTQKEVADLGPSAFTYPNWKHLYHGLFLSDFEVPTKLGTKIQWIKSENNLRLYKLHLRCPNIRTAQVSFCRSLLEGRYPAHRPACLTCFTPSRPAMSYRLPTGDLEDGAQWPSGLGAGKRRCQGSPLALSKVCSRLTQHPMSPQGDMLGHCELNAGLHPCMAEWLPPRSDHGKGAGQEDISVQLMCTITSAAALPGTHLSLLHRLWAPCHHDISELWPRIFKSLT